MAGQDALSSRSEIASRLRSLEVGCSNKQGPVKPMGVTNSGSKMGSKK